MMGQCVDCNEHLEGDGYSTILHCPNAPEGDWLYEPPDAGVVLCGFCNSCDGECVNPTGDCKANNNWRMV